MKFTSPPNRVEFYQAVWEMVRQIPYGRVATYGQIASLLADPDEVDARDYNAWAPRWVGGAMAACPADVPWQRVINSQGKISLRPGGGQAKQKEMLEEEGVQFDDRERVDLSIFGWEGPEQNRSEPQQLTFNHIIDGES